MAQTDSMFLEVEMVRSELSLGRVDREAVDNVYKEDQGDRVMALVKGLEVMIGAWEMLET